MIASRIGDASKEEAHRLSARKATARSNNRVTRAAGFAPTNA
jgi:hypothetical protein